MLIMRGQRPKSKQTKKVQEVLGFRHREGRDGSQVKSMFSREGFTDAGLLSLHSIMCDVRDAHVGMSACMN